jgi:hypothetical protein
MLLAWNHTSVDRTRAIRRSSESGCGMAGDKVDELAADVDDALVAAEELQAEPGKIEPILVDRVKDRLDKVKDAVDEIEDIED